MKSCAEAVSYSVAADNEVTRPKSVSSAVERYYIVRRSQSPARQWLYGGLLNASHRVWRQMQ